MKPPKRPDPRFKQQIAFIEEIDKVKSILRHTLLIDGSRRENDAEHAWHLAMMALVFSGHARAKNINLLKVIKMVLIHDIVEIDCGDAFLYNAQLRAAQKTKEKKAARRIFSLLPRTAAREMITLWEEFEARTSPESKFAAALDRFQPILHNYKTQGRVWRKAKVTPEQVLIVNRHIEEGAPILWELVKTMVADGEKRGFFGALGKLEKKSSGRKR